MRRILEVLGEPEVADAHGTDLLRLDCLLVCRVEEGREPSKKMLDFRPSSTWVVRSFTDLKNMGEKQL